MSQKTNSNFGVNAKENNGSMWLGALVRQHLAHEPIAAEVPGVVIPGERLSVSQESDESESFEIAIVGKRVAAIAHPIPSAITPGFAAITDYLNCTFPFDLGKISLTDFFKEFANVAGHQFKKVINRGKGMNGYLNSFTMGDDGAIFCYGGQRGTALIMIPGKACYTITDWLALIELLRDKYRARITRWDGAVDDFEGTHSVDWAAEQYLFGNFTNGGNKPSSTQNGNWLEPDGKGRTLYIGKRKNGKMLRVYEKGMQCAHEWHPWVRYELELHNVDRVIPWEVLLDPGKYVVGGYPKALSWIQDEMCRIKTLQTETKLSYKHLVECALKAYGRLINVMIDVEGSPENVIEKLRKDGKPKRLQMPNIASKDK